MNKKVFSTDSDVSEKIDRLNTLLANQISLPRVFLRGVVAGLGSIIGATIVMGFLIGLLAWALVTIVELPVIGGYIDPQFLNEQLIEIEK